MTTRFQKLKRFCNKLKSPVEYVEAVKLLCCMHCIYKGECKSDGTCTCSKGIGEWLKLEVDGTEEFFCERKDII